MNTKLQGAFIFEVLEVPFLPAREGKDTLENTKVKLLEVRRLTKELDPNQAHGPNGISPSVFRVCRDLPQRAQCSNRMEASQFRANIAKKLTEVAQNYRPVSVMSIKYKKKEK